MQIRRHRRKPQRGILLLIVLSLLVLFILIGVTFIVVAGQYTKAAKAFARHDLKGDAPARELDEAALLLLRGSNNPGDLLYRHNLLNDLYGNDGFLGVITAIGPGSGGTPQQQFFEIAFADLSRTARPTDHFYAGGVLTLLDGEGVRHSARIISYTKPQLVGPNAVGTLIVEAFGNLRANFVPAVATKFLVNGKPFNGTGDGLNPNTGELDAGQSPYGPQFETALMPFFEPMIATSESDESWDAADYQNVFLARIPSIMPPTGIASGDDPLLPSFHRPYLINYWMHRLNGMGMNWADPSFANLRRWVIARPMPDAHPLFTGSNPKFAGFIDTDGDSIPDYLDIDNDGDNNPDDFDSDGLIDVPLVRGPWDVDNDGDGIADSVWIDLGAPVKTAPDGRVYKPLYAILCVDMDGRVNINAHGSLESLTQYNSRQQGFNEPMPDEAAASVGGGQSQLGPVTIGQGYGPAEIRPEMILPNVQILSEILFSRYQPRNGVFENPPAPGWPDYPRGQVNQVVFYPQNNSLLSTMHLWGLASYYAGPQPGEGNLYLTPPDLAGTGGIYLDHHGQPRYRNLTHMNFAPNLLLGQKSYTLLLPSPNLIQHDVNPAHDDPYEFNLVELEGGDHAFGEDDLEQLLRYNDLDAQTFTTRLGILLRNFITAPAVRNRLTTRSFDIPTLNAVIPEDDDRPDLRELVQMAYAAVSGNPNPAVLTSHSIVELLHLRLIQGIVAADPNDPRLNDPVQLDQYLRLQTNLMLPPDVRQGKRFDINRLFGNGVDEDGNGVVDEPAELLAYVNQLVFAGTPFEFNTQIGFDDPRYGANSTNPYFSRQLFARYLYCLALLAADDDWRIQDIESPQLQNDVQRREATARRMAQWAINVVDFRDRDAIMTPFEYDANPFDGNGWSVDDNFETDDTTLSPPQQDRRMVWGCEYPELLITETKAFHDRRVKDTNHEEFPDMEDNDTGARRELRFPMENSDMDPMNNNQDFDGTLDQLRIPQGSLFIELYAIGNSLRNTEALPLELYDVDGRLDLARTVQNVPNESPVWRVAIAVPPTSPDPQTWAQEEDLAVMLPALLPDPNPNQSDVFLNFINDRSMAARFPNGVPDNQLEYDRFILFTDAPPAPAKAPIGEYYYNYGRAARNYPEARVLPGSYAVVGPRPATALGSRRGVAANQPSEPSQQRIVLARDGIHYYDLTQTEIPTPLSKVALPIVAAANPPSTWANAAQTAPLGIGINVSEPNPSVNYYREPIANWPPTPRVDLDPGPGAAREYREPFSFYDNMSAPANTLPDIPLDNPPQNAAGTLRPLQERPDVLMTGTHRRFRVALLQRLADPTRSWNAVTNPYITVDSQAIDLTVFNGEEDSSTPPPNWEIPENPANGEPYDIVDDPDMRQNQNIEVAFQARQRGQIPLTASQGPNIWNPISTEPTQTPPGALGNDFWNFGLFHSFGALNPTYGNRRPGPAEYLGAPERPFPWLTWNNRPYVSPMELMLVPSSAPWRLPFEMRQVRQPNTDLADLLHAPFGHLLNFLHDNDGGPDPNFGVLLDWLEVPSRFVGTQKFVRFNYNQALPALQSLRPPFNKISKFRDPGKVNLNTIVDDEVWAAVANQPAGSAAMTRTQWDETQLSLKGDSSAAARPAFYANPLRAAGSADLVPPDNLRRVTPEATLLRTHPVDQDRLLFDYEITGNFAVDPNANPYFQFHSAQRLANLVTSHSNVFAVWITVGYFEVLPWDTNGDGVADPDAAHPDGYQLARELGSDTGQIKRHRAFYLIDRSIPVGYERGQSHNVENTILLRRQID
jgi:hypothetical protein